VEVRAGAEEAGRDPNAIEVVARLHVVMVDDPSMGRNLIRTVFGAYAATPGYNKCFEWIGFEDEARQIREAFAKRDRAGVAAGVTDRLCDAMAIVGDRQTVRARIRAYAEAGIDVCIVNPIADLSAVPQVLEDISGMLRLIPGASLLMSLCAFGCGSEAGLSEPPIVYEPGPTCTAFCTKVVAECDAYSFDDDFDDAACVQSCEEDLANGKIFSAGCREAVEVAFQCAAELDCQHIRDRINGENLASYPCLPELEAVDITCLLG